MPKNEIAAYVIMESAAEPVKVNKLEVFDKNNLFYLRFESKLQDFNVLNRNKRIYMGHAMVPSLNAEHIKELQANRSWFGEAGHPMTDDVKRILTIDPKLTSHRIVSHSANTNSCSGVIETLDNTEGRNMTKLVLQGMEPAFSLRALAPLVKKPDGTSIVQVKAHVVTYDWVILPSHKTAYRDKSKPIEQVVQPIGESGTLPVSESALRSYIMEESANVNLVSNICEVALDKMTVTRNLRNVIIKEGQETYIIPLEEKIHNDINAYMRKL